MDIHVLGVGEAADPDYSNAAIAVGADGYRLLVDCGHSVPPVLWRKMPRQDSIDGIVLTGVAPDRALGVVPLLLRWGEDGRRAPLDLAVGADAGRRLVRLLDAAGLVPERDLPFPLRWLELDTARRIGPFGLTVAPADTGLAVGLEWGGIRCVYGATAPAGVEAAALCDGARLVFLTPEDGGDGTAVAATAARFAQDRRVTTLLLHRLRRGRRDAMAAAVVGLSGVSLALPGQLIRLR